MVSGKGETMDKEQAIEKLNDIRCHVKETSAEEQALVMAIDALKQPVATDTNVGDTISRQAAIDALDFEIVHITAYCDGKNEGNPLAQYNKGLEDGKKAIEALPPAQPEQIWILCDERMPEEHEWIGTKKFGTTISDEVYVTFENPKGERFCKHLSFQNGKLSAFDKSTIDAFYKGSKPIAWMPLPVPYQRGGEEDVRKPD